jgi:hypothetical protein
MSIGLNGWLVTIFLLCFLVHVNVFGWVAWVVDVSTHPLQKENAMVLFPWMWIDIVHESCRFVVTN